jgi:transcriptional regulator with XRE-family HTH domain
VSVVSDYERGFKTPPLLVALKLQLIYHMPLAELFPGLQSLASAEVADIREKRPYIAEREKSLSPYPGVEDTQRSNPCIMP